MRCPRCQHDNPPGTKFCGECAAPLASVCGTCGAANPPDNKFCGQCAAPLRAAPDKFPSPQSYTPKHLAEKILTSRAALEGERKQVTVLFADLKGSMELLADRDPEEARKLLDPVLERMMEAVHRYEGTVNQVMGDGIMALFGAPLAHEDHAVRACYAALRMQESVTQYAEGVFRSQGVPIQIRVGLNSGEVVVRAIGSDLHMDYTAVGQTTHLAARMEQMATPGTILLAPATLQLAEGYVSCFEQALAALQHLPEARETLEQAIDLRFDLRTSLHPLGEFERIVGCLREAEGLARTLDDQRRLGQLSVYLCHNLWMTGHPTEAVAFGQSAQAIAESLEDVPLQVTGNLYLGAACLVTGDYRRAEDLLLKVLQLLGPPGRCTPSHQNMRSL